MQNINIQRNKKNKGFSLVEMLVAIAIFMSIMTLAISSLISIINATKRAQTIKTTIDSVTFALENISRDMRIGRNYKCLLSDNLTFGTDCDLNTGSNAVQYTNDDKQFIAYRFIVNSSGNAVITKTCLQGGTTICKTPTVDLISADSNVKITKMTFYVIGANCEFGGSTCTQGRTQPRVVITASGLISSKGSTDTTFNLQTNISQRSRSSI